MAQQLPKDSLILVTGANGYLGSHVSDLLLESGYRVRGTVRNLDRSAWVDKYFNQKYPNEAGGGEKRFELVHVADTTQPNCLDEAIRGVSAIAHMASDLGMDPDPNKSVMPVVNSVRYALEAAAKEPGCKSFVLTSSSTAATLPHLEDKFHVTTETWNEPAIRLAWADSYTDLQERRWSCYAASKAQGEKVAWKFVEENKPHFTLNTILPNANFGPILDSKNQEGSAAAWIRAMYVPEYFEQITTRVKPQWYVHTHDTAKLHVACLTDLSLNGERLLAFGEPFNWNDILEILHRLTPDKDLPERWNRDDCDQTTVDTSRALEILKRNFGQDGWTPLEQGVKDTVESFM